MKIFLSLLLAGSALGLLGWNQAQQNNPAGQTAPDEAVTWLTVEQAYAQMQADANAGRKVKKVFIDVYTDWCGWCKKMDATTFADPKFSKFLSDNFYPVKFNAEQRADILLGTKGTFKFKEGGGRGGVHEYAVQILNGQLSYPTVVFLDETFTLIQPVPGFRDASEMRMIASYFSGDFHKTTQWDAYKASYKD